MHIRPPMSEAELAQAYRKYSALFREASRFDCDLKTSQILKRIATDYDRMADALESLHRTNQSVGRRSAVVEISPLLKAG
jgi:hypothetical protein